MIKTAVPSKSENRSNNDAKTTKTDVNPNNQFIGAALSMSWQLAIVVLVPIIGGFKLDQYLKTSPAGIIIGFIIAMVGTTIIIRKSFNEFNETSATKGKK